MLAFAAGYIDRIFSFLYVGTRVLGIFGASPAGVFHGVLSSIAFFLTGYVQEFAGIAGIARAGSRIPGRSYIAFTVAYSA